MNRGIRAVETASTKSPEKRGAGGAPIGNTNPEKHGLHRLKRALKERGLKAIDGRSEVGRALFKWRADLIQDLGGQEAISTQEAALVDLCVKSKLLLDSVDAWLLGQRSLVNARKRVLLPVVRERQQLADGLARHLGQLGLKRREKPVSSLAQYLQETYGHRGNFEAGENEVRQGE